MINKKTLLAVIILTICIIWGHSMMPPDMSEDESGMVVKFLELFFGQGNVNHLLIRKMGHFIEYFVLGCELVLYFQNIPTGAFHGLFVAAMDETIQIISSRGSSLLDVWLDFVGCFTGILFIFLIRKKASTLEHSKK